jgi:hypothetical protein
MFTITCESVYNSPRMTPKYNGQRRRHPNKTVPLPVLSESNKRIKCLQKQVNEAKQVNERLKRLAVWNLRSTKSALKDVEEMLTLLEELYGDEATE